MHVLLEITPEILADQPPCPIEVAWYNATNTECNVVNDEIQSDNTNYKMSKNLQVWLNGYYNNPSDAKPITVNVHLMSKTAVI